MVAGRYVALLRGINVGTAKRVAMADLRVLVEELGYGEVRTFLCMVKLFRVDEARQGKRYSQKMVEVYHVVEGDAIIVITVYVFFGTWES
jgi:uncharacterized protein (DUF1697 family)